MAGSDDGFERYRESMVLKLESQALIAIGAAASGGMVKVNSTGRKEKVSLMVSPQVKEMVGRSMEMLVEVDGEHLSEAQVHSLLLVLQL